MKRRGTIKNRMLPLDFDGPPPAFGAEVLKGEIAALAAVMPPEEAVAAAAEALAPLADKVWRHAEPNGISGRTVTLKLRRYDFTTLTRSQTLPQPTDDARQIAAIARRLLADGYSCRAQVKLIDGLRLPRVLALFARKMGARFIAEPLYDAGFRRFSLPLVAALDEIPARTLSLFDAVTLRA